MKRLLLCYGFVAVRIQLGRSTVESIICDNYQPINDHCFLSYRNQSIDLQSKSTDWFLHDEEHGLLMG